MLSNLALQIVLIIVSFVFVLSGVAGVIFPFLPSIPLAWVGVLIFAFATNFTVVSLKAVLIFLLISLLAMILEFFAPIIGASKYHASKEGIAGSFIGTIVGFFVLGPIGVILGGFGGLILAEMSRGKNSEELCEILKGAFIGFLMGGMVKLLLTLSILAYLIIAVFKI